MLYKFLILYFLVCIVGYWVVNFLRYKEQEFFRHCTSWREYLITDQNAHIILGMVYFMACGVVLAAVLVARHLHWLC